MNRGRYINRGTLCLLCIFICVCNVCSNIITCVERGERERERERERQTQKNKNDVCTRLRIKLFYELLNMKKTRIF